MFPHYAFGCVICTFLTDCFSDRVLKLVAMVNDHHNGRSQIYMEIFLFYRESFCF